MANIVIVGDADGGAVAHDIAELKPEFDPSGGVLGVPISLITGKEEQRLVVTRPGILQMSFGKKPPRHLTVEISNALGPVRVQAKVDETTGQRTLQLPPGRYNLQIGATSRKSLRLEGIEVRAGETCSDPRLTAIG